MGDYLEFSPVVETPLFRKALKQTLEESGAKNLADTLQNSHRLDESDRWNVAVKVEEILAGQFHFDLSTIGQINVFAKQANMTEPTYKTALDYWKTTFASKDQERKKLRFAIFAMLSKSQKNPRWVQSVVQKKATLRPVKAGGIPHLKAEAAPALELQQPAYSEDMLRIESAPALSYVLARRLSGIKGPQIEHTLRNFEALPLQHQEEFLGQ